MPSQNLRFQLQHVKPPIKDHNKFGETAQLFSLIHFIHMSYKTIGNATKFTC